MRDISTELQNRLQSGVTTMCRCWRITRADNTVLGFTDHDQVISFEGIQFDPSTGFEASQIQTSLGMNVDTVEIVGALSSERITEVDIIKGLYDDANVEIWFVDWQRTDLRLLQFRGTIGKITRESASQQFIAELNSLSARLNDVTGRAYTKICDAELGDARCGVVVPVITGNVTAVESASRIHIDVSGDYTHGIITWTTGENAGVKTRIRQHARNVLDLWQDAPLPVKVGDAFTMTTGCDKQLSTCRDKFNNYLNFQGFPYIVGDDWVMSYPSSGQGHDGGSRYG